MKPTQKIILATSSPFRVSKFKNLGIPFESKPSKIDERFKDRPKDPRKLVLTLAKMKAKNVAEKYDSGIIIGFDTIAYFNGEIYEKISSKKEAFNRLKKLSGEIHTIFTGIHLIDIENRKTFSKIVKTEVKFRKLTDSEIMHYLNQDDSYKDSCLGYDSAGSYSESFAKEVKGSHTDYRSGMPLETIVEMLKEKGYVTF